MNAKSFSSAAAPVAAAVCAAFLFGCGRGAKQGGAERPPQKVETAQTVVKDVPLYVDSFGRLTAVENVDIQPQVSGKLMSASFREGDRVGEGDLLFEIESNEYHAAVLEAEARLASSWAELKKRRATLKRNRNLLEKDLVSKEQFEDYETAVEEAEAQVELNAAALQQAKINLDYCSIRSPIDGVTGKRLVDPGNIVSPSAGSVLVNIRKSDPLHVDFTVPEDDLPAVARAFAGDKPRILVRPKGMTNAACRGVLSFIDNKVDHDSGTVALRGVIDNSAQKLWPGQFVYLSVVVGTASNAVLAPDAAVQMGKNGPYVFSVKADNTVELKLVKKGPLHGNDCVIRSGLEGGETVATSGQLGLYEGAAVAPVQSGKSGSPEQSNAAVGK